jgi:hypothetical protein
MMVSGNQRNNEFLGMFVKLRLAESGFAVQRKWICEDFKLTCKGEIRGGMMFCGGDNLGMMEIADFFPDDCVKLGLAEGGKVGG